MTDTRGEDIGNKEESSRKPVPVSLDQNSSEQQRSNSGNLRQLSYMVLFIAAVFVISAMETGSYRTPWPVAIITGIIGFGLLGYSLYLQSHGDK